MPEKENQRRKSLLWFFCGSFTAGVFVLFDGTGFGRGGGWLLQGAKKAFLLPLFLLFGQAAFPVHPGDGGVGGGIGVSVSHSAFLLVVRPGDFFFSPVSWKKAKRKKPDPSNFFLTGGRNRTRTCDPIDVNDVLYQLSHATMRFAQE